MGFHIFLWFAWKFCLKYDKFNCGILLITWTGGVGGCARLGTCAEGSCGWTGSGTCAGGAGAGRTCGAEGAGFCTWSGGNGASGSGWGWVAGCGGSIVLAFAGLHAVGSFSAGGPLSASSVSTDLV